MSESNHMNAREIQLFAALSAAALVCSLLARPLVGEPERDAEPEVRSVPSVDLERYAGRWYEIARLPNKYQKKCACCVTATYTLRDDGKLTVVNECTKDDGGPNSVKGEARLKDADGPTSQLEVRFAPGFLSFLGIVWGDYWVLDLDPEYSRVLVGDPNREFLWVLAREPELSEETYSALLETARSMGFDVSRVEKTPQEP